MRRPFKSWIDFIAYAAITAAMLCGFFQAPYWTPAVLAMILSLSTWGADRWQEIVKRGQTVDEEWKELASLSWQHGQRMQALGYWLKASVVWTIYGAHIVHNLSFAFGAYAAGWLVHLAWR